MYRAAVIGDRDSIYGFAALGLEVFPVTDSEMGSKTLRRLAEGEYAVIYITEALAAELEERRGAIQEAEAAVEALPAAAARHHPDSRRYGQHGHGH